MSNGIKNEQGKENTIPFEEQTIENNPPVTTTAENPEKFVIKSESSNDEIPTSTNYVLMESRQLNNENGTSKVQRRGGRGKAEKHVAFQFDHIESKQVLNEKVGQGEVDFSHLEGNAAHNATFTYNGIVNRFQQYFSDGRTISDHTNKPSRWENAPQSWSTQLSDFAFRTMDMVADSWPLFIAATATAVPIGVIIVTITWIIVLLSAVILFGFVLFVAGGCLLASMLVFPLLFGVMSFISLCGAIVFVTTLVANFTMTTFNRSGIETPGVSESPYPPATPLATPNTKRV